MNKYQKSLNTLRKEYLNNESKEYDILQELVEKATPKKILKSVDENGEPCLPRNHGVCPICGFVVEYSDKHCHECGQRLE